MHFLEVAEAWLHNLTQGGIVLLELMGVFVLIIAALRAFADYLRRDPMMRLRLAKSMTIALEFKLGGEILRTVLARDFKEIATVAAIIALRAALNFLLHWEIKNVEAEGLHPDKL